MPNAHDVFFRTLADPTQRAIFERLCREGDQTVGALTARSGISQPAVSKHLEVLKQARLVRETLSIIVEREIPFPPEKIRRALTQPSKSRD